MKNTVNVLMATYNGAKYLNEQIDSILNQSYSHFNLYICDDGSTDETVDIIKSYVKKDKRVYFEQSNHLGACKNFTRMINNHKDNEYVMLCDQDDVWDSRKIEKSLELISKFTTEPTLVYCDKAFVDESLNPLSMPIRSYNNSLKSLLCQCHIYGCTMMMNKKLVDMIDIPEYASMHDHWISLIASLYGKIIHLEEPLIYYRQHSGNVTGGLNQFSLSKKMRNWNKTNKILEKTMFMCYEFCKSHDVNNITKGYADIFAKKNIFRRIIKALKFGYRLDHFTATLRGFFVLMNAKL